MAAIDEARRLANQVVLGQLSTKLQTNPDADLSEALKQQSTSYPNLPTTVDRDTLSTHHLPQNFSETFNRLLQEGEVLHALHDTFVISIGLEKVVKISSTIDPDHIDNLQYIHDHVPEIPTPRFLGALRSGSWTYLFLSRSQGVTLESVWQDLTTGQKMAVQRQLTTSFKLLRAGSQNEQCKRLRIGSFKSGICKDMRRLQRVSLEPIYTEADFNNFLCRGQGRSSTPWISMIRSSLKEDHHVVMTHGDLHPRNIMVSLEVDGDEQPDIRVSAILDWELAGWYPEHWEYVRALTNIDVRGPLQDWIDYLPTDAIGKHSTEYALDCLIGRWFG
ncbi:kinase-like domain-containing protein [Colletotrichum cereale]|nr:kinase-like domain-containing protein [Colletotrichum cereale]